MLNFQPVNWKEITVIELASVLAGPSVGAFFAELGAHVIKVENKTTGGDVTRNWKSSKEDAEAPISAYYSSVNYWKEVHFIDYNNPAELSRIHEMIQKAQIVISNFKPGSTIKWQLDYDSLKDLNPTIISGEIKGYPDTDKAAFDVVLQAETGYISMTGTDHQHLAKLPVALIDVLAAHQLKEGILVAMLNQQKSVKPHRVVVSLYETALASLVNQASNYLMSGLVPQPIGTTHPNIAPYGDLFYDRANNPFVLAVGTEKHFQSLCDEIGLPELNLDPLFSTNANRVKNRTKLYKLLQKKFEELNRDSLLSQFEKLKIPSGAVQKLDEVFESKSAKNLIIESQEEGMKTKRVRGNVFNITS